MPNRLEVKACKFPIPCLYDAFAQTTTCPTQGVPEFPVQNPGEVLIFVIEDHVTSADIEATFRESRLDRLVSRGAVTPPFRTLREMIDADQRLVVFGARDRWGGPRAGGRHEGACLGRIARILRLPGRGDNALVPPQRPSRQDGGGGVRDLADCILNIQIDSRCDEC
jgi:hypothetical protein